MSSKVSRFTSSPVSELHRVSDPSSFWWFAVCSVRLLYRLSVYFVRQKWQVRFHGCRRCQNRKPPANPRKLIKWPMPGHIYTSLLYAPAILKIAVSVTPSVLKNHEELYYHSNEILCYHSNSDRLFEPNILLKGSSNLQHLRNSINCNGFFLFITVNHQPSLFREIV